MGKLQSLMFAAVFLVTVVGSVAAVHAEGRFESGLSVLIPGGQTINQTLFISGQTVDVAGTVNGDVYCVGRAITVTGTINGDVLCAGQSVTVTGKVTGNIRLAGQSVSIGSQVNSNVSVLAQTFSLESNGQVGQDLSVAAQELALNGNIGRDALVSATNVTAHGNVGRDLRAYSTALVLGSGAHIGGNLVYTSDQEVRQDPNALILGKTAHYYPQQYQHTNGFDPLFNAAFMFYFSCAMLLIALFLILLFPRLFVAATDTAIDEPFRTLCSGLVLTLGVPLLLFILCLTFVGLPLAVLLFVVWITVCCLAWTFGALTVGRILLRNRSNNSILYMLVGSVVVLVLSFVPIIGKLVTLVSLWYGLGAAYSQTRRIPRPNYTV